MGRLYCLWRGYAFCGWDIVCGLAVLFFGGKYFLWVATFLMDG